MENYEALHGSTFKNVEEMNEEIYWTNDAKTLPYPKQF